MARLASNAYGKERVRLTKVARSGRRHTVHEYAVEIMLEGDFDRVYTEGDNAACVPTDTMKNTVYAVARQSDFDAPELFAGALAERFISRYPQIAGVDVSIVMEQWRRIAVDGEDHPHAFIKSHDRRTARLLRRRAAGEAAGDSGDMEARAAPSPALQGGITGMEVFKSSGSRFTGFYHDEYTALPETDERILATTIDAVWDYAAGAGPEGEAFNDAWSAARRIITEVFATHDSPSLQATLYLMGERVLAEVPLIESISFTMPNQHHILFDLDRFGLDNPNEIFYGTDSPSGIITGSVARMPTGGTV